MVICGSVASGNEGRGVLQPRPGRKTGEKEAAEITVLSSGRLESEAGLTANSGVAYAVAINKGGATALLEIRTSEPKRHDDQSNHRHRNLVLGRW
jgi:hypothetical protein